jgi:hypothetical protein
MNNYPVNNLSTFELIVGNFNDPVYPWNVFIDFRHKYDCDSFSDGGYITVSWDNGLTWVNIINDTSTFFMYTPHNYINGFGNFNLYDSWSGLVNDEPGFTGHSGNWVHSGMAWFTIPVNKRTIWLPDTMRLRFNFVSDNIEQNREGWMIDQIRLYSIDLGYGIQEYLTGRSHSYFFPNPVKTTATFMLNKTYRDVHFEILDSRGVLISKSNRETCDEFTFDRTEIPPGIYFMRLYLDNRFTDIHRIVIIP